MVEKKGFKINGFVAIIIAIILGVFTYNSFIKVVTTGEGSLFDIVIGVVCGIIVFLIITNFIVVQPNESRVLTFFGKYAGSIKESGFWMVLPFTLRSAVSLKISNFNSKMLKVNDIDGNPIEIAAVVVFRVVDTAKAIFDVQNYDQFVEIQSETALRHVATKYPYDTFDEKGYSLRGNSDEVAKELTSELQQRLAVAGVEVIESRLTHLAYATEIASAMLQRQQAMAIIAARQKIVEGAVGMAQMAISQLESDGTIKLDEERKMAMINNLMVAIVSDRAAQPIINTGSLY